MTSSALAHAPKSVRDEAQAMARRASSAATKRHQTGQAVKLPAIAGGAGLALGLLERFMGLEPAMLGGIDNGVIVGAPLAAAGAVMFKGKLGQGCLVAGSGLLASGLRTMGREFGADGGTEGL